MSRGYVKLLMQEKILRNFVKQVLLNEEIVTVYRGTGTSLYDASFDEDGNLVSAKPHTTSEEDQDLVSKIQITTLAPASAIHNLIEATKKLKNPNEPDTSGIQQVAMSPEHVVSTMQSLIETSPEFAQALQWKPANMYGRGEAALKLAFKFSEEKKEPDFVSKDGNVMLSVKYFGNGAQTVRSGVGGGSNATIIEELKQTLGIKDFGKNYSGVNLLEDLEKIEDRAEKLIIIEKCSKILDELKYDLATAHGAQGIFGYDSKGIFWISPEESSTKLKVYAIRENGARAEFFGPHVPSSYTSLESALIAAMN